MWEISNWIEKTTDADTKMTQMLDLFDKDYKSAITKMLLQAIMKTLETNEKIKSLSKEIEHTKKNVQILELKKYKNQHKNLSEWSQ